MNNALQKLLAIESIRTLKARYFRLLDIKDWPALADCFTEDVVTEFEEVPDGRKEGREAFISHLAEILAQATTVHHGHMPEIEVLNDCHATGIWAMEDIVDMPGLFVHGWGHYHESYRKEQGAWRIARLKLTRLRLLHNGEEVAL